jgi:hypothetical protein
LVNRGARGVQKLIMSLIITSFKTEDHNSMPLHIAGNGISRVLIFKTFQGACTPESPRELES